MSAQRYLIVNADDFGQSCGINAGVIETHEHGIVTSASLMVRGAVAREAAAYARAHPELSVGLHVDLGEWTYRNGEWTPVYQVVRQDDHEAVAAEVARQLAIYRELMGSDPTHLDSHQHAHLKEPARSILLEMSRKLAVPLRSFDPQINFCGEFYAQTAKGFSLLDGISVDGLLKVLARLPVGISELGCHPASEPEAGSMYSFERPIEVCTLCDPRLPAALATLQIRLCTFEDVKVGVRSMNHELSDSWFVGSA